MAVMVAPETEQTQVPVSKRLALTDDPAIHSLVWLSLAVLRAVPVRMIEFQPVI
jgi:hypothetical protein